MIPPGPPATESDHPPPRLSLAHYDRVAAACAFCGPLDDAIAAVRTVDRLNLAVDLVEPDIGFIARLGPVQEDIPLLPVLSWESVGDKGLADSVLSWESVGDEGLADSPWASGPWMFAERAPAG